MTLAKLSQYGKPFQVKVLGSLLTDKAFLLNVRDTIQEDYFDSDSHKWILKSIVDYFDKYHTVITMDVLKIELVKIENDVLKTAIKEELRNSYQASQQDLEYIQEEFHTFCKNQKLKQALMDYDGTLVVISHDRDFLDGLTSEMYEFSGGNVKQFLGGVYEFLQTKKADTIREFEHKEKIVVKKDKSDSENKLSYEEQKQLDKDIRNTQNKVKKLEKQIKEVQFIR